MPEVLEDRNKTLKIDEIFIDQFNQFNIARDNIKKSIKHPISQEWEQINEILTACDIRVHDITHRYYFRAMSYGAMRIVNNQMTDVLNTVLSIGQFMENVIKQHDGKNEKTEKVEEIQGKHVEVVEHLELEGCCNA